LFIVIFDIKSFQSHYGPGVDSASNRNVWQKWVPGVFPGVKGGQCVSLTTYHHPVPLSWNLGALTSWNPLGLSSPVMGLFYLFYTPNTTSFDVWGIVSHSFLVHLQLKVEKKYVLVLPCLSVHLHVKTWETLNFLLKITVVFDSVLIS